MKSNDKRDRRRGVCGTLLISLLAVSGYWGSQGKEVAVVSVPVNRVEAVGMQTSEGSLQDTQEKLKIEREREIALLEEVVRQASAGDETQAAALAQLSDMTKRMEAEAVAKACLEQIGMKDVVCISGANGMTLICPMEHVSSETDRVRVFDAICGVTGYEASDIKIILAKK